MQHFFIQHTDDIYMLDDLYDKLWPTPAGGGATANSDELWWLGLDSGGVLDRNFIRFPCISVALYPR
jgi:hypothetical protein